MNEQYEETTDPATPAALGTVPTPPVVPASNWRNLRKWVVDGGLVACLVYGVARGWVDVEAVIPAVTAIVLAHLQPGATSIETAVGPVVRGVVKLLRKGA